MTLSAAVVLRPGPESAVVLAAAGPVEVRYGGPFGARAQSLAPGHLVAVSDGVVLWRWYDAVVLEQDGAAVRLWEPGHGEVQATARDAAPLAVGTRAYASAGLPGADWWVEGPVVPVAQATVALDEVAAFYTAHDLWQRL